MGLHSTPLSSKELAIVKIHFTHKLIKMLCNCIPKRSYETLTNNEKVRCTFSKVDKNCENDNCVYRLVDELKKEKWHHSPEDTLLKTAFAREIIKDDTKSISELKKKDKENLETILIRVCKKPEKTRPDPT